MNACSSPNSVVTKSSSTVITRPMPMMIQASRRSGLGVPVIPRLRPISQPTIPESTSDPSRACRPNM